jgi:hypothetical protein
MITSANTIKGCDLRLHLDQHHEPRCVFENNNKALSILFLIECENVDVANYPWYKNIVYYLQHEGCLDIYASHERMRLRFEASKYLILGTLLFRMSTDGISLRCIQAISYVMLEKLHGTDEYNIHIGGHFAAKSTASKILRT